MRASLIVRFNRWLRSVSARKASPASPASPVADTTHERPLLRRLVAEPWYVDRITISDAGLQAAGWSMPVDTPVEPPEGWFTVNGHRFDAIRYPLPRSDVGAVFWQREGSALSGFECSIAAPGNPYPDGVLEIRRVRDDTPEVERGRDSWFKPDPALHADLPDEDRRFRVIGDRNADGFLISGATDYHRMDRALVAVSGRHLHEFDRVLDWGVGCGRVARHFPAGRGHALTGCDIDHDNLEWCRSHLQGTFVASNLAPPLPFAAGSFDLVWGISVFTHFREMTQLRWLEELARVTAPGALLLLTTHGQTAIDFSRLPPAEYRRVQDEVHRAGILVSGGNTQLDGHADHGGEYVNVYHSTDYVRDTWGRYFSVEHILPGYILHHDLAILRKR